MTTSIALTRAQKAAAILVAMGKPSASRLLKFFKQEELKALIEGARQLRTIPQSDLEKIVAEFEAEFTEGAGQLDSADRMEDLLNETLSPEEVEALKGDIKPVNTTKAPPPIWPQLEKVDPLRLGAFIAEEHPQTSALVLSKLAPQASANVLLTLEKGLRGEIIKRMMNLTSIPETATKIVEGQLRGRVLSESTTKDISAGQSRVASVLNEMEKSQMDEVMEDLEKSGAPDLDGVRARLFSFDDIVLMTQKARVALFDGLSSELVTLALRGAPPDMTEAVLSAIGARSRRMIESELSQGSEGIPMPDILKARRTIASTAIRMSHEGVFELPTAQAAAA